MWPFKKNESTCCSGVVTCDGEHHSWSVWTPYERELLIYRYPLPDPIAHFEDRQKRKCEICGFTEDKLIIEDLTIKGVRI